MRLALLLLLLSCSSPRVADQEPHRSRVATPLNLSSGEKGYVQLGLDSPKLVRGGWYSVDYSFHNTSGSYWVYNCFFDGLLPLPGQLAIYDSKGQYIGDLLPTEFVSRRGVADTDWLLLRDGSHVGTSIRFRAELPPGRYYIQLILYKAFLSSPSHTSDFYKSFDRSEAVRSNLIEIDIVD